MIKDEAILNKAHKLTLAMDIAYKKGGAIECVKVHIDDLISNLESIPKLTICEIEGDKCYGIIDFYKDVKNKIS